MKTLRFKIKGEPKVLRLPDKMFEELLEQYTVRGARETRDGPLCVAIPESGCVECLLIKQLGIGCDALGLEETFRAWRYITNPWPTFPSCAGANGSSLEESVLILHNFRRRLRRAAGQVGG